MIPKIIHYCWFGKGKKPKLALKCIESWKKHLPDYKLKEWNEDNFDLDLYPYTREAYDNRKYAFVTDVVRLYALYNEGGIYMDTDVEVLKSLDKFLLHTAFSGFEDDIYIPTGIIGSKKNGTWIKNNLDLYNNQHFINNDGIIDLTTNVIRITNNLLQYGLKCNNTYQDFPNMVTIYEKDVFCPKSHIDGKIHITDRTTTIHHFLGSWMPMQRRIGIRIKKIIGEKYFNILLNIKKSFKH